MILHARCTCTPPARQAFTLVEVMAVVLIAGILSAAAVLSLGGLRGNVQMDEVLQRLGAADRFARACAIRQQKPVQLLVDLDQGRLSCLDAQSQQAQGQGLVLPEGYRLEALLLPGRSQGAGQVSLPCSAQGRLPTYALRVAGPGQRSQWIVVAGLSGQVMKVDHEKHVQELYARLPTGRDDAD